MTHTMYVVHMYCQVIRYKRYFEKSKCSCQLGWTLDHVTSCDSYKFSMYVDEVLYLHFLDIMWHSWVTESHGKDAPNQ